MNKYLVMILALLSISTFAHARIPSMHCFNADKSIRLSDDFLVVNDELDADNSIMVLRTPNMLYEILDLGGDEKVQDITFYTVSTKSYSDQNTGTFKKVEIVDGKDGYIVSGKLSIPFHFENQTVKFLCKEI